MLKQGSRQMGKVQNLLVQSEVSLKVPDKISIHELLYTEMVSQG